MFAEYKVQSFLNLLQIWKHCNYGIAIGQKYLLARNTDWRWRLCLDDRLADVLAAHHTDERVEHVFETFGHGFAVTEFALAYPLQVLHDSLAPTIRPACNNEALHLQLVEYYRRL